MPDPHTRLVASVVQSLARQRPRERAAMTALTLALSASAALADCTANAHPGHFEPVPESNGAEVRDTATGLVWRRCSEGQSWDGTSCVGTFSRMTYDEAMAHAEGQPDGRLPSLKELQTLVNRDCTNPAIDTDTFPNTPGTWYWTRTPYAGSSADAWIVGFSEGGFADYYYQNFRGAVRLVRTGR
ncbi:hypothetical protein CK623_12770 [Vandammella animalimorsus]|uniref:Lcl C-terminal domain-containing protein n=1 Tax=Vandammella animalimorsus TaxID=2029117 RepID=A0A2A2AMA6_9BURK|nr:DUF1566 domain-containing protein [Vandammella animalimorsus]PAT38861.1 hypothetical protein CK623_12770 [Vandammella animalimorsus]